MGLTISYKVSFKGTAEELLAKLETVRQKCLDQPFHTVGEIDHILYRKADIMFYRMLQEMYWFPNNTEENLQKRNKALKDRGLDIDTMIDVDQHKEPKDYEVIKWGLWAGKGCEGTNFTFIKKGNRWSCTNFTKTQYAENFVRCHLAVIFVLDELKNAGLIVRVKDEGHYWDTRSLKRLAKEINDYTNMIVGMFNILEEKAKDMGIDVESPITQCENYIKDNRKKTE